jgi:hypothetical protein
LLELLPRRADVVQHLDRVRRRVDALFATGSHELREAIVMEVAPVIRDIEAWLDLPEPSGARRRADVDAASLRNLAQAKETLQHLEALLIAVEHTPTIVAVHDMTRRLAPFRSGRHPVGVAWHTVLRALVQEGLTFPMIWQRLHRLAEQDHDVIRDVVSGNGARACKEIPGAHPRGAHLHWYAPGDAVRPVTMKTIKNFVASVRPARASR